MSDDERFRIAIEEIDAANAEDPMRIVIDGRSQPKELAHSRLMTAWVEKLDPDASPAQLLAARAHHLKRWSISRDEFDTGRAGYLRWRTELSKLHAAEVAHILRDVGYDEGTIARVQQLIRKQGLKTDPAVQTHEDALCLVFLSTQFADLAQRLGRDKTIEVVAKTVRKMSPAGLAAAGQIALPDELVSILAEGIDAARTVT